MGNGIKKPMPSEIPNKYVARKSLVALAPIRKGEVFSEENLGCKRPGRGLSPALFWSYVGQEATSNYDEVTLLFNRKVVMIGWGGHAKVLKDVLDANETTVAAVVAPEVPKSVQATATSDDEFMSACNPSEVILVNAVGSLPGSTVRRNIFDTYKQAGFEFLTIVSEGAILSPTVVLEEGVQVMLVVSFKLTQK